MVTSRWWNTNSYLFWSWPISIVVMTLEWLNWKLCLLYKFFCICVRTLYHCYNLHIYIYDIDMVKFTTTTTKTFYFPVLNVDTKRLWPCAVDGAISLQLINKWIVSCICTFRRISQLVQVEHYCTQQKLCGRAVSGRIESRFWNPSSGSTPLQGSTLSSEV